MPRWLRRRALLDLVAPPHARPTISSRCEHPTQHRHAAWPTRPAGARCRCALPIDRTAGPARRSPRPAGWAERSADRPRPVERTPANDARCHARARRRPVPPGVVRGHELGAQPSSRGRGDRVSGELVADVRRRRATGRDSWSTAARRTCRVPPIACAAHAPRPDGAAAGGDPISLPLPDRRHPGGVCRRGSSPPAVRAPREGGDRRNGRRAVTRRPGSISSLPSLRAVPSTGSLSGMPIPLSGMPIVARIVGMRRYPDRSARPSWRRSPGRGPSTSPSRTWSSCWCRTGHSRHPIGSTQRSRRAGLGSRSGSIRVRSTKSPRSGCTSRWSTRPAMRWR